MAVMDRHRAALAPQRLAEKPHDRLDAGELVLPGAVTDGRVRREALRELVPLLQVEVPPVAILELLDRLDILDALEAPGEIGEVRHGVLQKCVLTSS